MCVVVALYIFLILDFLNALVFIVWEVNLDSFDSYYNDYDENSIVGGMMFKVVIGIIYFALIGVYTPYAYEAKRAERRS